MDHHQLPNTGGGWWRVGRDDFQQLAQRILQFLAPGTRQPVTAGAADRTRHGSRETALIVISRQCHARSDPREEFHQLD
ncbi:MAG: hypothetical protein RLZZ214_3509 [Verrucomicrobiota bacterium]